MINDKEEIETISNKKMFIILGIFLLLFLLVSLYNNYGHHVDYIIYKIENGKKIETTSTGVPLHISTIFINKGSGRNDNRIIDKTYLKYQEGSGLCEKQNNTLWKCGEYYIQFEE